MAVRIRKLARELGRSPVELLGVLHALGMARYRSPEDMLSAAVEAKLRRGIKRGVQPEVVKLPAPSARRSKTSSKGATGDRFDSDRQASDFMARHVPGVVPSGGVRPASSRSADSVSRPPAAAPRTTASAPATESLTDRGLGGGIMPQAPASQGESRALSAERDALESARRRLMSEKAVFESERAALEEQERRLRARERGLEAEQHSLASLRTALESERDALDLERSALQRASAQYAAAELVSLQDVLEDRGLRGSDEFERALVALAKSRQLRDALWTVRLDPPDRMRDLLENKLVLSSGPVADVLGRSLASVEVAPERAELPSGAALSRYLSELSERLMLNGLRRVLIVGGRATWLRIVATGVDSRIEVRTSPASARTVHLAEADVVRADVVVLWGVDVTPAAREVYDSSRALLVEVSSPSLVAFFDVLGSSLDA